MKTKQVFWEFPLKPITGSVFQATGFPDIGYATFIRPIASGENVVTKKEYLLVESAQSMANHLEDTLWDGTTRSPIPLIADLPWIRVLNREESFLTSSRLEAHRLASAWIKDSTLDGVPMIAVIRNRFELKDEIPLNYNQIANAVFSLDPIALIHGVFFADSKWPGQPKFRRAITATIEASDVETVNYGGVKRELVRHKLNEESPGTKEGYGSVPYHRQEFAAGAITLHVAIDEAQLESYGLGEKATELLVSLAKYEVSMLLEGGLRARTNCNLIGIDTGEFPSSTELEDKITDGIRSCDSLFPAKGPIDVVHEAKKKEPRADRN